LTPTGIINPDEAKEARRGAGRPTRDEAALLQDRILDAAQAIFLAQGFAAGSLNEIAEQAGATKRTLYVKVGDKAELFAATVRRMLTRLRARLRDPGPEARLQTRLESFMTDLLALAMEPDLLRLHRLLMGEMHRFPELVHLMEEQLTQEPYRRLALLLREEHKRGRLRLDDPEQAARLLTGMVANNPQRRALLGLAPWPEKVRRNWVHQAVALFLRGCETHQAGGGG
jgi:AcrR family transcriptional regulator